MARIIYDGKISGAFNGFNENALFKMANGTYWIQSKYKYWHYYEYQPKAVITEERGAYTLTVAGETAPVKPLKDAIESTIEGTFNGWQGSSKYKLTNGQVWQQCRYKYDYKYSYRPEAVVGNVDGEWLMFVEGSYAVVRRG